MVGIRGGNHRYNVQNVRFSFFYEGDFDSTKQMKSFCFSEFILATIYATAYSNGSGKEFDGKRNKK